MATTITSNFDPFAKLVGSPTGDKKDAKTPITTEILKEKLAGLSLEQNKIFRRAYNLLRSSMRKVKGKGRDELIGASRILLRKIVYEDKPNFTTDEQEVRKLVFETYLDNQNILDALNLYPNLLIESEEYLRALLALGKEFPKTPRVGWKAKLGSAFATSQPLTDNLLKNFLDANPDILPKLKNYIGDPTAFSNTIQTDTNMQANLRNIGMARPLKHLFDRVFDIQSGVCRDRQTLDFDRRLKYIFPELDPNDIYKLCDFSEKYKDYR